MPRMMYLLAFCTIGLTIGCDGSVTISLTEDQLQPAVEEMFPVHSGDWIEQDLPVSVMLSDPKLTLLEGSDRMSLQVTVNGTTTEKAPELPNPTTDTGELVPDETSLPKPPADSPTEPSGPRHPGPPLPGGPRGERSPAPPPTQPQPPVDNPQPPAAPPREFEGTVTASGKVSYRPDEASFYLLEPTIDDVAFGDLLNVNDGPVRGAIETMLQKYFAENSVYTLSDDDTTSEAARMLMKSMVVENGKLHIELGY